MSRRVDARPVDQRIRVAGRLHAVVAGGAAVGVDPPAAQHRERHVQLVLLRVVDHITGLEHGGGMQPVDGRDHAREDERRQGLLRAERRRERRAQPVEHLDPRRGLLVRDVRVGQLCEDGEPLDRSRGVGELGAVGHRLGGADLQPAVAVRIDPRAHPRGAGRLEGRLGGRADAASAEDGQRDGGRGHPCAAPALHRSIVATVPARPPCAGHRYSPR
jgi:hypothetical protein